MILIGEINITYTKGIGEFYCPTCEKENPCQHKRVRRFLTIYFIPTVPLDLVSEHVRCLACRENHPLNSMELGKEDYERERVRQFAGDVKRVMVLTMLADGVIEDEEVEMIQQFYRRLGEDELTEEQILHEAEQARRAGTSAALYAQAIAGRRTDQEKAWIIRGAFAVATANGELSEERLRELKELPQALGIEESRFREIIDELASR
jgi:tellurite resistance protein